MRFNANDQIYRIDISINATIDSFTGAAAMWQYPSWSWPIMQYIVPQTKRVRYYRKRVGQILKPLIQSRMQQMKEDPSFKKPMDMIQWFIDNSGARASNMSFQANEHIVVNIAAIHTTGGQLAHTLYDLARYPEYVPILREEIEQVLQEEGGSGAITKQTLFNLKKMDSFLREVQRVNPPSLVSTNRKIFKSMKLSDGTELPVGTSLAAPAGCVSKDPELWENPEKFDGLRCYKLRQESGDEKYQFASANKDALSFGKLLEALCNKYLKLTRKQVTVGMRAPVDSSLQLSSRSYLCRFCRTTISNFAQTTARIGH